MSGVIIEDIGRDNHNYFQPSALGQKRPLKYEQILACERLLLG